MTTPALVAASVASLIIPQAEFYIPPKPAIVKAHHLDMSRHMLLGMPMTMGMLAGGSDGFTLLGQQTFTGEQCKIAATPTIPAGTSLVIIVHAGWFGATASTMQTYTLNGTTLSIASADGQSGNRASTAILYRKNPASGSQSLSILWGNNGQSAIATLYYLKGAGTPTLGAVNVANGTSAASLTTALNLVNARSFVAAVASVGLKNNTVSATNLTISSVHETVSNTSEEASASNATPGSAGTKNFTMSWTSGSTYCRMAAAEFYLA